MRGPMDTDPSNRRRFGGRGRGRPVLGRGFSFSGRTVARPSRGGGPPIGLSARPSSYKIAKSFNRARKFPWEANLLRESIRTAGIESGTKLYVFNLDYGVTNEDIRELFSEIGELCRYAIHYDKSGRPTGSAEVVYLRRSDAIAAVKRYDNVQLDGKPMKLQIIDSNSGIPIAGRVNVVAGGRGGVGGVGRRRTVVMTMSRSSVPRGGFVGFRRGEDGGGRRGSRGWGRGRARVTAAAPRSAQDLDKDLENYHANAMET